MANARKLLQTLEVVKENQGRWEQGSWVWGDVNPDPTVDYNECGTSFCFAGWMNRISGWLPAYRVVNFGTSAAPDYVYRSTEKFYRADDPDSVIFAPDVARELGGLDVDQADFLFDRQIRSVTELEEKIRWVIDGKDVYDYEDDDDYEEDPYYVD